MQGFRVVWFAILGLLAVSACDDPSNVGVGLIGEEEDPTVTEVVPSTFDTLSFNDVTGNTQRVLAGQVDDPVFGTVAATGYLDFTGVFDNTSDASVTDVELQLRRDYVYGDTTSQLTLTLRDIPKDWSAAEGKADTTIEASDLVTQFDVAANDTLVTIPLPSAWVAANEDTLLSSSFASNFHGFKLEATGGNAVVGFAEGVSSLRVITDADTTIEYSATTLLTGIRRMSQASIPDGRMLVQDGTGPTLKLDFDVDAAELAEKPLNGVVLRLFADSATVQSNTPPNFYRPPLAGLSEGLKLSAIDEDGRVIVTAADAVFETNGHLRFQSAQLRELLQQAMLGNRLHDAFELTIPPVNNTINALLLHDARSNDTAPKAYFTLAPASQ